MPEIMPDRETASDTEKITGRNKLTDKKREIYRINASANSIIVRKCQDFGLSL